MFRYPKVPRYGLPFVEDDFWSDELIATEKTDGSLYRFTLYDARYADAYTDEILALDPTDGDIVAGTSDHVRWLVTADGDIRGGDLESYGPTLDALTRADCEEMRALHDAHGPLVWFAEAMTGHLIDYDDAPALLGFDVYAPFDASRDHVGIPEEYEDAFDPEVRDGDVHPYDLRWEGFLEGEAAFEAFEQISVPPMHDSGTVPRVDGQQVDPDEMTIPLSQYADVQAEGVVFRNPRVNQRVKVRSDIFQEVKKHHHVTDSSGEAPPAERFVAEYATPIRIMKTVLKMVNEDGRELSMNLVEDARHRVYDDIWEEEWMTIKEKPYPIDIPQINRLLAGKTAEVVGTMIDDGVTVDPDEVADDAPFSF